MEVSLIKNASAASLNCFSTIMVSTDTNDSVERASYDGELWLQLDESSKCPLSSVQRVTRFLGNLMRNLKTIQEHGDKEQFQDDSATWRSSIQTQMWTLESIIDGKLVLDTKDEASKNKAQLGLNRKAKSNLPILHPQTPEDEACRADPLVNKNDCKETGHLRYDRIGP